MAPYFIRIYQESDRKTVVDLLSQGITEHIPATFRHVLKLPRTLVLFVGGPLLLLQVSGSWLLALMFSFALLPVLWFFAGLPYRQFVHMSLQTDMADITKSYLREPGSCFWVAESAKKVVGTVGALPVDDPTLQERRLQLFHLVVASEHRKQGIAKALIRTVLQFARDQGYSAVVLDTSKFQQSAMALYQCMGFKKVGQSFPRMSARLVDFHEIHFICHLPSA
ncbi:putative N-acetyltransferase 8B [Nycticebus coucang]|uniref:putative N-acetyltransferase 8B n=1 Tax=Nycticebus coucang TaxID=9470 RepID=UPI00234DC93C|nr:putative N-acetyltransferase 8B [Nycticebus coucang]XP_053444287.1 putative N-acetyltransferase 8B [Nycticebus coucang]